MSTHTTHAPHDHVHGNCAHPAVKHEGHVDYLHDGHMHSVHGDHVDEHRVAVDATHPAQCTHGHECTAHDKSHIHSASCGHAVVPHGDHADYLVADHLHHAEEGHCDNHGALVTA